MGVADPCTEITPSGMEDRRIAGRYYRCPQGSQIETDPSFPGETCRDRCVMDVKHSCRTNICHSDLDGLSKTDVRFDIVHAARICMFLYRVSGCRGGVFDEFARDRCRPHLEYFISMSDVARLSRLFQISHRLPRCLFGRGRVVRPVYFRDVVPVRSQHGACEYGEHGDSLLWLL